MGVLFDSSVLPLTGIGGTANAITATVDPALPPSGLVDGMKFALTIPAVNTGPMTLAINGRPPVVLLNASGGAIPASGMSAGLRIMVEYVSGAFRTIGGAAGSSGNLPPYRATFTVSGTWFVPQGRNDDETVIIEIWGAGGGGGPNSPNSGGGGGGAYRRLEIRYGDLASSYSIAIGAGGAVSAAGGNSTVGALATAYGGAHGAIAGGPMGGGHGGGAFGPAETPAAEDGRYPQDGGGGGYATVDFMTGGRSVYAGGGGAARESIGGGAGGLSLHGGSGGAVGVAGQAPAGGGGAGAAGARGEVRIRIGG